MATTETMAMPTDTTKSIPAKDMSMEETKMVIQNQAGIINTKRREMELNYVVDITSAYNNVLMTYGDHYQVQRYTHGIDQISIDFWMLEDHDNGWIPNDSEMNLSVERQRLYYLHDELRSVTKVVRENGKTLAHYNYDEFGVAKPPVKFDQNWPGPDNIYGYTGYQYDVSAELWYAQARYYMPEIGRFILEDPWKGTITAPTTMNPYLYVLNNPLKFIDPLGLNHLGVSVGQSVQDIINNNKSNDWGGCYEKAKQELWDAVYNQYPLAKARLIKKGIVENALKKYKDEINKAGERYGVPPEIIAGIIVKEQMTQSWPDGVSLADTVIRNKRHSVGLGAIFPQTARNAWYEVDLRRAYIHGIYGTDAEIELKLTLDDEANINTIAVVLNYYARDKFATEDMPNNLTMEQWKEVVGRYNALDGNPEAQKNILIMFMIILNR